MREEGNGEEVFVETREGEGIGGEVFVEMGDEGGVVEEVFASLPEGLLEREPLLQQILNTSSRCSVLCKHCVVKTDFLKTGNMRHLTSDM